MTIIFKFIDFVEFHLASPFLLPATITISLKVVWTDFQCVLQWPHSKKPLSTFVTNRLKEVKSLEGTSFRYIPTQENPAELATRGKSPSELLHSIWWNGPSWLTKPQNQ